MSRVDQLRQQREADYEANRKRVALDRAKAKPMPLAARINEAHRLASASARTTLEHAKVVGDLLHEAKRAAGHGAWGAWLAANVEFGERQAQRYMRVSEHWAALSNPSSKSDLGIAGALDILAAPKDDPPTEAPAEPAPTARTEPERRQERAAPAPAVSTIVDSQARKHCRTCTCRR